MVEGGGPDDVGMRSHGMSSEEILGRSLRSILRMVPEYAIIKLLYSRYYYTTSLVNYYMTKLLY